MRLYAAILLLPALLAPGFGHGQAAKSTKNHAAQQPSTDPRIAQVESGLLPAVIIKGDPHPTRTLAAEMQDKHVTALSVAVIHNGQIAWAKGYGITREGGPPVTPDTLFQAASISKSFTATAALRLVQQGKMSLDAPIQTELKSWTLPENNFTAQHPVTLRELLSHTAGTSVHGFPGYASDAPVPSLRQVLQGEKPANTEPITVVATPGQAFSYSGGGYTIVQQALIDTTGEPFPELMKQLVLDPLGLHNSTYEQPLDPTLLARAAFPADGQGKPINGGPHIYPEMAAAGLWTTPTDLAKWLLAMQRALSGDPNQILSPETAKLMITPVKGNYGLGVETEDANGKPCLLAHSGSNAGYKTYYLLYADGDGVAVMTNADNGGVVYAELLRSIAAAYGWPGYKPVEREAIPLDPKAVAPYLGKFQGKGTPVFEVLLDNNHLVLKVNDISQPFIPAAGATFFTTDNPMPLEFHFDSPDSGTVNLPNAKIPFTRVH